MLVTLSPIIYSVTCEPNISEILEEDEYALFTIASELIVTEVSEEQLLKASSSMLVTLLGMVIEVSEEQLLKVPFSMLVTLLGIVMEVRASQARKALSPMLVTLLGMVIEVREEQWSKA